MFIHTQKPFRLNPQLRRVTLSGCGISAFENASQYLPALEYLKIEFSPNDSPKVFRFKSVKRLGISVVGWVGGKSPDINLLFDQLEEVEMNFDPENGITEAIKLFKKHQSITKLKFKAPRVNTSATNKKTIIRIMATLPLLNDFTFGRVVNLSVDEFIDILAKYKSLKRFCVKVSNPNKFDCLRAKLSDTWETSINDKYVELNRKI